MKYSVIENNVNQGKNKVFNDWNKWGLITKEEFLKAAKWISEDPMDDLRPWDTFKGRPTRFLGLTNIRNMEKRKMCIQNPDDAKAMGIKYDPNKKTEIIKLTRKFDKSLAIYFKEDGTMYDGNIIVDLNDLTGPYSIEK